MLAYEYFCTIKLFKDVKPFSSVRSTSIFLFNRRNFFFFQTPLLMLLSSSHIHLQVKTTECYAAAGWLTCKFRDLNPMHTEAVKQRTQLPMHSAGCRPQSLVLLGKVTVKIRLQISMFVVFFFYQWVSSADDNRRSPRSWSIVHAPYGHCARSDWGSPLCCVRRARRQTLLLISPILTDDRAKSWAELGAANERLMWLWAWSLQ